MSGSRHSCTVLSLDGQKRFLGGAGWTYEGRWAARRSPLQFFGEAATSILQGLQFLKAYAFVRLMEGLYTVVADYLVLEQLHWSIIADAWSRVLREVLLCVMAAGYTYHVLHRHPPSQGRFVLLGRGAPRLRRDDWRRFLSDAGWVLLSSYCDVLVVSVAGILSARLSSDEASANQILLTSSAWPCVREEIDLRATPLAASQMACSSSRLRSQLWFLPSIARIVYNAVSRVLYRLFRLHSG